MNKIAKYGRIFLRDKISLLLGIGSLTIGIAVSLIIGLWYMNETSYDNFHPEADNIYRVCRKAFFGGESKLLGGEFNPLGKNIAQEFPEVTEAMRIYPMQGDRGELVKIGNQTHFIKNIDVVDNNFFEFFNYEFKQGNPQAFIDKPNSIIIDEQTANQLFPNDNAMGKIISYEGEREVVGILKNLPSNTHLRFHALLPIKSISKLDNSRWGNSDNFMTYIKLAKNTDQAILSKKIREYSVTEFKPYKDIEISYFLQPLQEIHLSTGFYFEIESGVKITNPQILDTFLIIGLVILLIACINFINLFISGAFLRAKAIGLKKMNGARRLHIIAEFISETFFYTLIALFIALLLCYLALPYFSQFIGYELALDFTDWQLWAMLIGAILFISIFAGVIPGLYMSSFATLETLKGHFRGKRIIALQKTLVIVQFTTAIALLIGVFFINKQVHFMNNVDLGFNKDQLVYINIPKSYVDKIQSIQQELEKNPLVKATCLSNGTTLQWWQGNNISKLDAPDEQFVAEIKQMQHNYLNVYGLQLIAGENTLQDAIDKGFGTECIINEETGKTLGLEQPYVGKQIKVGYRPPMTIKGVVKNAYTKSLTQKIDPQIYVRFCYIWEGMPLMVKTTGKNMKPVVELLRKQWETHETDYPFAYHFLDKDYESLYKSEEQANILALWTMVIALFLTIAGLWGMARYSATRRIKEIGIRKVNGATISEVIRLLNGEFVKWVTVSFAIAVPIAWYLMHLWLKGFVLKTALSWWVFTLSGLVAVAIALLTVTWQSYRAASKNPVEALRYE